MTLKVYSTLSGKKEEFKPINPPQVKIYLCGPTVYDYLHIGNFRGAITFNMIRNWLEKSGFEVEMVYNYTDVDDKIIKRANEEGVESKDISEKYIAEFEKDFARLGLKKHDHNPRVTEFMPQIVDFVQDLINRGVAYEVEGEVFYSIDKFENYGKLSGKKLDELEAGQRVEVDPRKKNPFDFVVWKPSKEGEPSWDSPWGKGRPGWHIECSAMIQSILGDTIDIHGGGIDLIFPHHENEIAQGEGRTGKCYCNYWVHNQFINMNNQKMSKSLGNIMTMRSFMDAYHPEVFKYLCLSVHYRSAFSLDEERLKQVFDALRRIYSSLEFCSDALKEHSVQTGEVDKALVEFLAAQDKKVKASLDDDFNTAEMVSYIFEAVRHFNGLGYAKKKLKPHSKAGAEYFLNWLQGYGKMAALFLEQPGDFLDRLDDIILGQKSLNRDQVEDKIQQRLKARENKDFELADKIKQELTQWGIELRDGQKRAWEVQA